MQVGFEINKKEIYAMRFKEFSINGAFEVTYKQRSQFILRAATYCKGFFIRKQAWHDLLESAEEQIQTNMKQKIMIEYLWEFRSKIIARKNKIIAGYKNRSDF